MILYINKQSLIDSGLTGRQVISEALPKKACPIQSSNKNVDEVVNTNTVGNNVALTQVPTRKKR